MSGRFVLFTTLDDELQTRLPIFFVILFNKFFQGAIHDYFNLAEHIVLIDLDFDTGCFDFLVGIIVAGVLGEFPFCWLFLSSNLSPLCIRQALLVGLEYHCILPRLPMTPFPFTTTFIFFIVFIFKSMIIHSC